MKKNIRRAAALAAALAALLLPGVVHAGDGFAYPHTLPFKLNSEGMAVSRESLRLGYNNATRAAAASGSGSATGQSNTNMANVIQTTENYEIVLNGDNNAVNTQAGQLTGTQHDSGSNQNADNQVLSNSTSSSNAGILNR